MSEFVENSKFKLDEAKYYFEQMKLNFQDRTKFLFSLDAFLSAARAVTFVFQNARSKVNESIMNWYDTVAEEWRKEKVMRLLVEMRNVSIKEHSPQMQTSAAVNLGESVGFGYTIIIKKSSPDGKVEEKTISSQESPKQPSKIKSQTPAATTVISRSFYDLPEWFDLDSDVMRLCEEWLRKLGEFVTKAEEAVAKAQTMN
jgi:hypothetical protein